MILYCEIKISVMLTILVMHSKLNFVMKIYELKQIIIRSNLCFPKVILKIIILSFFTKCYNLNSKLIKVLFIDKSE